MKYLLLTISLAFTLLVNAQFTVKKFNIGADIDRDTLIAEGKVYLLKNSPIKSFDGFNKLFKPNEAWIGDLPKTKGYAVTWIIKKGILYIDHIQPANWSAFGGTKSDPKPHDIYKDPVSTEEIRNRLEKLTGRKFNAEGLLAADWVTGEKEADANGHYQKYLDGNDYVSNENYVFSFENGKLTKVRKL